jgi:hypothetical protein
MIGGADLTGALGLGPGRRGRRVRGHRPQVASPLVGTARYRVAGRCEKVGSATILHPGPGRRSHSAGLPATRGQRRPTVAVELPGPGRAGRRRRDRRLGIGLHDPALAGRKRDQTLAVPVPDLRHRTELRPPRPPKSWTCTIGPGTENPCQQTTLSSPPTRIPAAKRDAGAMPVCPQSRPG